MREKKNKNDNVNDVNGKRDNKKAAGKFKNWTTALSMELREHKSSAIVYPAKARSPSDGLSVLYAYFSGTYFQSLQIPE